MVAGDHGSAGGGGGSAFSENWHTVLNVPQSAVLRHCFGAGLAFALQLGVLHVTAPGVPDWPAATPHLVAHPVGSACFHLPNGVRMK